jgi:hypothetical protein
VQAEVSRLDALLAELKASTSETGHAQALAGLRTLEAEVRSLTTNTVDIQATQVESQRLFQLVDLNDTTIRTVVSGHDDLLKQVDLALRTQEQAEVSRLDALLAELQASTSESGHAQALAGLRNLEGEVR